jgi:hypothetical protein
VAALLTDPSQRHELQLWAGALAPRLLEAGQRLDNRATRQALEDAWCDARVNRRWQQFAATLGETGVERLLAACAEAGLAGVRTLVHAPAQATEGWALASGGRLPPRGHGPAQTRAAAPAPRRPTAPALVPPSSPHRPAPAAGA